MTTFGLALSGGGIRGLAHIGVLKALEEMGYKPAVISGVSAGAIIGAFYCAGFSPAEIYDIYTAEGKQAFRKPHWPTKGVFSLGKLEQAFEKHLSKHTFEELETPLYVTATDILKGEQVVYASGPLMKPIIGSSAIPALFDPIEFGERLLVDGGILNNLAIEPLKGKCDKVIGVYVNPIDKNAKEVSMKDMIDRSVHLLLQEQVYSKCRNIDLLIEPPELIKYRMFDTDKGKEIFEVGYKYTLGLRAKIDKVLGS
jgi:NTE family protein